MPFKWQGSPGLKSICSLCFTVQHNIYTIVSPQNYSVNVAHYAKAMDLMIVDMLSMFTPCGPVLAPSHLPNRTSSRFLEN